jgi:hypothetical protein
MIDDARNHEREAYLLRFLKFTAFELFPLIYLLAYSMQQSPWETNRFSASQGIPPVYETRMFITAFILAHRHINTILTERAWTVVP